MNELKLIESVEEFIPIYETDKGEKVVNGRELHKGLGVQADFSHWIKNSLNSVDATEKDFYKHVFKDELSKTGQTKTDYILKLEIAKEICLVAGASPRANETLKQKSKDYRRYLIQFEERYKNQLSQLTRKEELQLQLFSEDSLEVVNAHKELVKIEVEEATKPLLGKIEEDKPLVDFAETISKTSDSISIGDFAKLIKDEGIKLGRNKLFEWLRDNKYLMKDNKPYQKYIDNGYFEIIEYSYNTPYGSKFGIKTLITGIGQIKIIEKLRNKNN